MRNDRLAYYLLTAFILTYSGGKVKDTFSFADTLASNKSENTNTSDMGSKSASSVKFTLPNGLEVIFLPSESGPLTALQVFSNGGSINEKPSEAGLANFTQVMLQQGTKSMDSEQLNAEIEDTGGSISSYIEPDYSNIGISVLDSNLDKAARLLADVLIYPKFDDNEIEKERANIIASLNSRKDHISQVTNDTFNTAFYGSHPYAWPDSGKLETVKKFKKADLIRWHDTYYSANNMLLVIAGAITPESAKRIAETYFAQISSGTTDFKHPEAKMQKPGKVVQRSTKFHQAYLMVGYPAPSIAKDEYFTLKVLNSVLGGRMTGRLFIELREKLSLAYEVNSGYPSRKQLSRFIIYIGLENKNLKLAKKRIDELLNDLKTIPVPLSELHDTKNYIKGTYLLERQTIGRRAWYAGWWETMGLGADYDKTYLDKLMTVSSEDIQKAAIKYFNESRVTVEVIPADSPAAKKKK